MDRQETLTDTAPARESPLTSVGEFAAHAATIAELQWQLFTVDSEEAMRGGRTVLAGMAFTACLTLSALVLAMHGAAEYLATATEIPPAAAMAAIALLAFAIAGGVGAWTLAETRRRRTIFQRSQRELRRNLASLRRIIDDYAARSGPLHAS